MNPRAIGNFFKSKFGLFVVFVVVLFSGLALYGRHQAKEREAAKLAAQNAKKVELGQVRVRARCRADHDGIEIRAVDHLGSVLVDIEAAELGDCQPRGRRGVRDGR